MIVHDKEKQADIERPLSGKQIELEKIMSSGPIYLKDIYFAYITDCNFPKNIIIEYKYPCIAAFEKLTMFVDNEQKIYVSHIVQKDYHEYFFEVCIKDPYEDYSYVFRRKLIIKVWPNEKAFVKDVLDQVSEFVFNMKHSIDMYQDAIDAVRLTD